MIARWSRSVPVGLAWAWTISALLGPACQDRAPVDKAKPAVAKRQAKPAVCQLQRPATSPLAPPGAARLPGLVWALACGALAALAYRGLLWAEPAESLPAGIEEWFFLPSESISPAVLAMSLWLLYRRD